ncbi:hypothetical protein SESBI_00178 [Sesbania bispinosa]|nr:hypothetical protein SESBI_00178 [Sesbania bispinosa]
MDHPSRGFTGDTQLVIEGEGVALIGDVPGGRAFQTICCGDGLDGLRDQNPGLHEEANTKETLFEIMIKMSADWRSWKASRIGRLEGQLGKKAGRRADKEGERLAGQRGKKANRERGWKADQLGRLEGRPTKKVGSSPTRRLDGWPVRSLESRLARKVGRLAGKEVERPANQEVGRPADQEAGRLARQEDWKRRNA